MPLPQQVIDRMSQEPPKTPGWSSGILMFSGGILLLAVVAYFGLSVFYTNQLDGAIAAQKDTISGAGQSISSSDQANLITFYSQVTNLNNLINNHVFTSHFFTWLQANTDANISYSNFSLSIDATGYHVTLTANAQSEADIVEQLAILQSSAEVKSMSASNISINGSSGAWSSVITLAMNSNIFASSFSPAAGTGAATATTTTATTTTP